MRGQEITFYVPMGGRSYLIGAEIAVMSDGEGGLHSFRVMPVSADVPGVEKIQAAIALLNRVQDAGMPWSLLTTFRNGRGQMAALVEAGDNRFIELTGEARAS